MQKKGKIFEGIVTSNKMDKTAVVKVERVVQHPFYKKIIRRSTKFKAHDAENACLVGDKVKISEIRPLSRDKRWKVVEIVKKAALSKSTKEGDLVSLDSK